MVWDDDNGASVVGSLSVNRIDTGNIGGSKLVDLDPAAFGLGNGVIASVFSVGRLYRYVLAPTAALLALVNGRTVVASLAVPGAIWVQVIQTTDTRFAANPPLFIDPAAGDDDNDGLTLATALKSADEWSRRMNVQVFRQAITFVVSLSAGSCGNFGNCTLVLAAPVGASVLVGITGSKTVSAAVGTVSSVVAQNTAAGVQQEYNFTDSSGTGPVIAAGDRLRIVGSATPANIGGVGVVRGFAAGGATNPYTSVFTRADGTEFFPAQNDTYVVETLTSNVGAMRLSIRSIAGGVGQITVTDVRENVATGSSWPQVGGDTDILGGSTNFATHVHCQLGSTTNTRLLTPGQQFTGCEFLTAPIVQGPNQFRFASCVFRAGASFGAGLIQLIGNTVFEGPLTPAGTQFCVIACSANTPILLSRLGATVGIELGYGLNLSLGNQIVWSPLVGARNAMTVGVQVDSHGAAQANVFATSFGSLSASAAPVTVCGKTVSESYVDVVNLCGVSTALPGGGGTGGLAMWRDVTTSPGRNPVGGSYKYSAAGGTHSRGSGGAISTDVPAGSGAAGHGALAGTRFEGGPTNTTGTAAVNIVLSAALNSATNAPWSAALDNLGLMAKGKLVGKDAANNVVSIEVARSFKRIAGVLTALGAATTPVIPNAAGGIGDAALVTCTGVLVVSGNSIALQATGVAATTISWNGELILSSTDFLG